MLDQLTGAAQWLATPPGWARSSHAPDKPRPSRAATARLELQARREDYLAARSAGLEVPAPALAAQAPPPSASLEPLETIAQPLALQTRHQARLFKSYARPRRAIIAALWAADEPGLVKRSWAMGFCCSTPTVRADGAGTPYINVGRCRDRMCPHCATFRAREAATRTRAAVERMDAPRFLTLTAPHVRLGLAELIRAMQQAWARLRRDKAWRSHVDGGAAAWEITYNKRTGTWHPHLHALIDGRFFPHAAIREAWRAALNGVRGPWTLSQADPLVVHVKAIHSRQAIARYIATYIAKPAGVGAWPAARIAEYAAALAGRRLLTTFGNLHGVSLDPPDPNDTPAGSTHLVSLPALEHHAAASPGSARRLLFALAAAIPAARRIATWLPWSSQLLDAAAASVSMDALRRGLSAAGIHPGAPPPMPPPGLPDPPEPDLEADAADPPALGFADSARRGGEPAPRWGRST